MQVKSKMLTISSLIYSLLLYVYPTPFRREYGYHMAQVFRDDTHDTLRESGTDGLLGLWVLTVIDLLKTALAEHIWEVFHMPLEKIQRWSGPAAATGGPFFIAGIIWSISRSTLEGSAAFLISLFLLTMPFMALGLAGLYRRLPASSRPSSTLVIGVALVGLLLYNAGFISLVLTERWVNISRTAVLVGFIALGFGIAGMGLIAIAKGALGRLSFAPLLLAVSYLGFAFIIGGSLAEFLVMLILVVYAIGWLLLGVALWISPDGTEEPALTA